MELPSNLNPSQLLWIQHKQKLVDSEMQLLVQASASGGHDWVDWNLAYQFQGKLYAKASVMKIPQWAVPDVVATWNAIRN
ncbi:hypothetical protein PtB15_18B353 [Puccinia triticina]|nr:hypothetical protein PtB15_18B353 [Puccinia triticina]